MTAHTDHAPIPQLPPVAEVTGVHSGSGAEIREAFSRSLARSVGSAQLVVTHRGKTLVDLAGGALDVQTPLQVYSVSKLLVAFAAAHAHGHGVLDLDRPLAETWPAFDRDATKSITARMVLSHSSGINGIDHPLTTAELVAGALDEAVEKQDPRWEPGTDHGYHPFTYGALMAGAFRHGAGITLQDYVSKHMVQPSGGRFWFGAPDEVLPNVAALSFGDGPALLTSDELADMTAEQRHGMDRTLAHVSRYGSGVELAHGFFPYFGGRSFGHQGAGGSVVAIDPDTGVVFAYTSTHTASTVGGSDAALTLMACTRQVVAEL